MRTRHTLTAVTVAVLLALTGCGTEPEPDAKAAASATADPEAQYLSRAHDIQFNGTPTDAELAEYPPQWCDALADGHSVEWTFSLSDGNLYPIGQDWGTAQQDAYTLLVAGVRAYCPENLDAVKEELRESGDY